MKIILHRLIAAGIAAYLVGGVALAQTTPTSDAGKSKPAAAKKAGGKSASVAKFKNPGDGTVNLNSATLSELQKLPGVGPSVAQKILDYRADNGGKFKEIGQLTEVKGIGEKKLAKLKPFLTL